MRVRNETAGDEQAIAALTALAFAGARHTSGTEQFIAQALRASQKLTVSLVAELDGVLIGHVAISPVSVSDGTTDWFGLGPVAVLPRHQGHGTGTRLVHQALEVLRARDAGGCVVLGEPAYYHRFGFRAAPALVLSGVPPEYFLALPFGAATARGTVTYHAAFDTRG